MARWPTPLDGDGKKDPGRVRAVVSSPNLWSWCRLSSHLRCEPLVRIPSTQCDAFSRRQRAACRTVAEIRIQMEALCSHPGREFRQPGPWRKFVLANRGHLDLGLSISPLLKRCRQSANQPIYIFFQPPTHHILMIWMTWKLQRPMHVKLSSSGFVIFGLLPIQAAAPDSPRGGISWNASWGCVVIPRTNLNNSLESWKISQTTFPISARV